MNRISRFVFLVSAAALAAALGAQPAGAQKSKNTLRIAFTETINGIDRYLDPKIESNVTSNMVFDFLIGYDDRKAKFLPRLAKSWKRIDAKTLELQLHDNITWHDGEKLDADDVIYTAKWLTAKKTKFRFKGRHRWIKSVEKTGPYTVRFHAKKLFPLDLFRLAYEFAVMPEHVHGKYQNKLDFRKNIVGTGPYRVAMIDKTKGLLLVKVKNRPPLAPHLKPSNIERFHFKAIADKQTQMAELITGGLDITKDLLPEQVKDMVKNKRFKATTNASLATLYVLLDAAGRTGDTPLKDIRVRKAMAMAINRKEIADVVVGNGSKVRRALCDPRAFGCASDNEPYGYDPAAPKKL